MHNIQPVRTYPGGRAYYFGTYDRPFNFRNLDVDPSQMMSLEQAQLVALGGVARSRNRNEGSDNPTLNWEQKIERYNQKLATTSQRREIPLRDLSDLQLPLEDRPAA